MSTYIACMNQVFSLTQISLLSNKVLRRARDVVTAELDEHHVVYTHVSYKFVCCPWPAQHTSLHLTILILEIGLTLVWTGFK